MSNEHLSGCSSLTTDGMLSKLDELLWDHEEPYLEEIPMGKLPKIGECMSEQNARDTQFQGFADKVCRDLADKGVLKWNEVWDDAMQVITRRAYDFAFHVIDNSRTNDMEDWETEQIVPYVFDMSELPKEQDSCTTQPSL